MVGLLLLAASTAGCTVKTPETSEVSTGETQEITTSTETVTPVISGSEMEEFTGEINVTGSIDSWVVPTVAGSDEITAEQSGVTTEVKWLIDQRKTQPADETKLDEEDISLMEQIIQKVQNLWK